jgi:two-component system, OmpR family, response regulator CpxR
MEHASRSRVLIVEDDSEVQLALAELLASHGYHVDVASTGADAIDFLESGARPDAVLVDLLMPGLVGQELLEYMRSDHQLAAIPVAIVSASPHLAPGGYTVFGKPFPIGPLLDFVRRGVSRTSPAAPTA